MPEPTLETLSAWLIVLNNLREVFGCSIVTDVKITIAFSYWVISFDRFVIFSLQTRIVIILSLLG